VRLFDDKLEVEGSVRRTFGASSVVVLGQKLFLDASLRIVGIGMVSYSAQAEEAVVLRILAPGLSRCEFGNDCVCNGTDCIARGLAPVLISGEIVLAHRRIHFEAPQIEMTRSSVTKVSMGGALFGEGEIILDGHLHLEMPTPARVLVANALVVSGRWTTVTINVTSGRPLSACLEYEVVQVLNKKQAFVSVSIIQGTTCAPSAQEMPKGRKRTQTLQFVSHLQRRCGRCFGYSRHVFCWFRGCGCSADFVEETHWRQTHSCQSTINCTKCERSIQTHSVNGSTETKTLFLMFFFL
jgi:hypothetical protein